MTNGEFNNKVIFLLLGEDYYNEGTDTEICNDLAYQDILHKYHHKSKKYLPPKTAYRYQHRRCEYCEHCYNDFDINFPEFTGHNCCGLSQHRTNNFKARRCRYYRVKEPRKTETTT